MHWCNTPADLTLTGVIRLPPCGDFRYCSLSNSNKLKQHGGYIQLQISMRTFYSNSPFCVWALENKKEKKEHEQSKESMKKRTPVKMLSSWEASNFAQTRNCEGRNPRNEHQIMFYYTYCTTQVPQCPNAVLSVLRIWTDWEDVWKSSCVEDELKTHL